MTGYRSVEPWCGVGAPPTDLTAARRRWLARVSREGRASSRVRPLGQMADGSGGLFDLRVFQVHRGGAAEDGDGDAKARTLLVDAFHNAVEGGERAVGDLHLLAEIEGDGGLGPLDAFFHRADDALNFLFGDRHRLGAGAQEARYLRGVLDEV